MRGNFGDLFLSKRSQSPWYIRQDFSASLMAIKRPALIVKLSPFGMPSIASLKTVTTCSLCCSDTASSSRFADGLLRDNLMESAFIEDCTQRRLKRSISGNEYSAMVLT